MSLKWNKNDGENSKEINVSNKKYKVDNSINNEDTSVSDEDISDGDENINVSDEGVSENTTSDDEDYYDTSDDEDDYYDKYFQRLMSHEEYKKDEHYEREQTIRALEYKKVKEEQFEKYSDDEIKIIDSLEEYLNKDVAYIIVEYNCVVCYENIRTFNFFNSNTYIYPGSPTCEGLIVSPRYLKFDGKKEPIWSKSLMYHVGEEFILQQPLLLDCRSLRLVIDNKIVNISSNRVHFCHEPLTISGFIKEVDDFQMNLDNVFDVKDKEHVKINRVELNSSDNDFTLFIELDDDDQIALSNNRVQYRMKHKKI